MHSPTVFVVANEPASLNILSDLFKQARLYSETFATAEAFLTEFDIERHGCLLLDMSLPGMGASELYRRLAQRRNVIPVIILTSHSDLRSAIEVLQGGALDFFEKPFDSVTLLQVVQQAIKLDSNNRHALRLRAEVWCRIEQLTRREREIMNRILASQSSREIASQLCMSTRTVESHRTNIMKKMGAVSLVELVRIAMLAFECHCIHKQKYSQDDQ